MTIDTDESIIFNATSETSTEIPLTAAGDKVKIFYQKGEKDFVDVVEFDNLNLGQINTTKTQEKTAPAKIEETKEPVEATENTNQ